MRSAIIDLGSCTFHALVADVELGVRDVVFERTVAMRIAADRALSDGIDWAEGDSPTGTSFARSPDTTGAFVTGAQSKALPNP